MPKEDVVELRWLFAVIRRWLWLIVGCTLLGATIGFAVSSWIPPVYSASASLLVRVAPGTGMSDYTAVLASERLAPTYAKMLKGRPVLEAVIAQLDLGEPSAALAKRVTVEPIQDTQLIRLTVTSSSPTRAALIANTLAEVFVEQNQALQEEQFVDSLASMQNHLDELSVLMEETQSRIDASGTPDDSQKEAELARLETILAGHRNTYATLQQSYEQARLTAAYSMHNVVVIEPAQVPASPVRGRMLYTTLAAVVSALVATGLAFLLEYLDDTLKTPYDVSQTLDLDTLGTITRLTKGEEELIVSAQPISYLAEAFRVLAANIRFSSLDRPLQTLLVTSPGSMEGKSFTVANLAVAMAGTGISVVAVDADLRRPRLHQLFGLAPHEGLADSLLEGSTDGRLQLGETEGLMVLTSGAALPANPVKVLGSPHMRVLLDELTRKVDLVLIDSTPVFPIADATMLAPEVDGVLLVLEAGRTRSQAARNAAEGLRQVGANLVGVVLNAAPNRKGSYHGYYGDRTRRPRYRLPFWR